MYFKCPEKDLHYIYESDKDLYYLDKTVITSKA